MFNSFELPKEIIDFLEDDHHLVREDGVQDWEILDSVIKLKDFPTPITGTGLQQLNIQPMKEVSVVILRIT